MTALGTVPSRLGLKATGYPLAYVAAKIALGWKAQLLGIELIGWRLENEGLYCSTSLVFDNLQGYVLECGWVEDEITGRGRTKEVGMNPRNPRRRK